MKRAMRRQEERKLKQRALRIARRTGRSSRWAITNCNNPVVCSCWMCGNPRKHSGEKTRGEIRSEEDLKSWISQKT